jgi:hypothetical protein
MVRVRVRNGQPNLKLWGGKYTEAKLLQAAIKQGHRAVNYTNLVDWILANVLINYVFK